MKSQEARDFLRLTAHVHACIYVCMATKTISIDIDAYEYLNKARIHAHESFSKVIKRAKWDSAPYTCGGILERLGKIKPLDKQILDNLEQNQRNDAPPGDPWKD